LNACDKLFAISTKNDDDNNNDLKFIYEKLKQLTIIAEQIEEQAANQDSNSIMANTNYEYLYDDMRTTRSQIRMYSKSLFPKEPSLFDFFK
jgi:uncharacterized membrane protein YgaE (UPF0421/DUF939 family)